MNMSVHTSWHYIATFSVYLSGCLCIFQTSPWNYLRDLLVFDSDIPLLNFIFGYDHSINDDQIVIHRSFLQPIFEQNNSLE